MHNNNDRSHASNESSSMVNETTGNKRTMFLGVCSIESQFEIVFFFKTVRISEEHTQTFRLTKIDKFSFMELNSHSLRYALAAHGFIPLSLLFGCSQEMGVSNYLF